MGCLYIFTPAIHILPRLEGEAVALPEIMTSSQIQQNHDNKMYIQTLPFEFCKTTEGKKTKACKVAIGWGKGED